MVTALTRDPASSVRRWMFCVIWSSSRLGSVKPENCPGIGEETGISGLLHVVGENELPARFEARKVEIGEYRPALPVDDGNVAELRSWSFAGRACARRNAPAASMLPPRTEGRRFAEAAGACSESLSA